MICFEIWWNSADADAFRAKHEEHDGAEFKPVWDAAVRAMLDAAPAAPAAPSALEVEITPIVMVGSPNACQVWLNRGAQQFAVGSPHETREDGEWFADMLRKAIAPAAPDVAPEQSQSMSRHSRAMLLNVLWHHQGGSSQVGQPIRRLLGIKPHARLNDEELAEAKWIDGLLAAPAQAEQQGDDGETPRPMTDAILRRMLKDETRGDTVYRCGYNQAIENVRKILAMRSHLETGEQPSARVALSDDEMFEAFNQGYDGISDKGDLGSYKRAVLAGIKAILAASAAQGGKS